MIKYKVKEVADDFSVKSKQITDILSDKLGVNKKAMTSLEPEELNVIFDVMTQKNELKDFSEYFAVRDKAVEEYEKQVAEQEKQEKEEKSRRKTIPVDKTEKKPAKSSKSAAKKPAKNAQQVKVENTIEEERSDHRSNRRVIDTRQSVVDVERYNQKYDDKIGRAHV